MTGTDHRLAREQLDELVAASQGAISLPVEPRLSSTGDDLVVHLSLDCAGTATAPGGLTLRKRERFTIVVPRGFPFDKPMVFVPHRRWADVPHVQWGSHLCLYAAPSIEWVPADGLFGLIERLSLWLEHAALGQLDPDDQPLHPPVAYLGAAGGVVVVRADIGDLAPAPTTTPRPLPGLAPDGGSDVAGVQQLVVGIAEVHSPGRYDVIEWVTQTEWLTRYTEGKFATSTSGRRLVGMLTILCDRELSFEYPKKAADLITALEGMGTTRAELFRAIGLVAAVNDLLLPTAARTNDSDGGDPAPADLHLLVGTPSRRREDKTLRQHLVCWRFDKLGRIIAENIIYAGSGTESLARVGALANEFLPQWIETASTSWVRVLEDRSEITIRRDVSSSVAEVRGRRVMVLGCGALGAPVAEFCVRAGAARVDVIDNDIVTPGILVRQPYEDDDIGEPKATALAARLNRIRRDTPVTAHVGSVETEMLLDGGAPPDVDLVIDATADATVAALLELRRAASRDVWPPVLSVMIGYDARRGLATIAKSGASGAGRDITRRLALAGRQEHAGRLGDIVADFFPTERRTASFQPEPGCSSPTFTGSATDLAALAGHLFDTGLRALSSPGPGDTDDPMVATLVRLDRPSRGSTEPGVDWLSWANDQICLDPNSGYEIRVSAPALTHMRAEVRRGARLRGPDIETGGLLLGQIDDASRCIWIDDVSGPPPDSLLSAFHFDHGVEGVTDLVDHYRTRSGRLTSYLGMWHSHPYGPAAPSPTDTAAMSALVSPLVDSPRRAVILIAGGSQRTWTSWTEGLGHPDLFARLITRGRNAADTAVPDPPPTPSQHRATAWPGGWRTRPVAAARPSGRFGRLVRRRRPR